MPRNAQLASASNWHMTKQERDTREQEEQEWRRGKLADFQPLSLTLGGRAAFDTIANAIPPEKMSKIDGYTIEACADAIDKMEQLRDQINREGVVVEGKQNQAVVAYAKYAEIAKRYLVELGCTPSARAKIANDAAAHAAKRKTVADIFNDD